MTANVDGSLTSVVRETDTVAIGFRAGGRVRCLMGPLKGVEGLLVATRTGGRVLVHVAEGLYFEVPRICVRGVDRPTT